MGVQICATLLSVQAKKLDEIHAEAHAELGMLPVIDIAQLPKLPGLQQLVAKPAVEEEVRKSACAAPCQA